MTTSTQWQLTRDAAERYESILVRYILGPAAQALVEWAEPNHNEAVLDVGCGTGAAARYAAEKVAPTSRVTGVDINSGMIAVARSLPPVAGISIEWIEGDAYELPFMDGEFDVAYCAQTLQFLQQPSRALAEIYRVLRPGGRLAVSVWSDIRDNPYFDGLVRAITRHIGAETAAGLGAAFNLADSQTANTLLKESEFSIAQAAVQRLDMDLPKLQDFVAKHVSATPMAAGFQAATEDSQQSVVTELAEQLSPFETALGVRVPFSTHLLLGIRQG